MIKREPFPHSGTFGSPNTRAMSLLPKEPSFSSLSQFDSVNNFLGQYSPTIKNITNFGQILSTMTTTKNKVTSLGEKLRELREQSELSLREVANEIGIDTSLLGKIERNERPATKEQIKQIAIFFSVNEKLLLKEFLSDQFAYKIIVEEADLDTLKVAEAKVKYFKNKSE